jgi:hypothetical protein
MALAVSELDLPDTDGIGFALFGLDMEGYSITGLTVVRRQSEP